MPISGQAFSRRWRVFGSIDTLAWQLSPVGGLVLINGGSLLGTTVSLGLVITFIGYSQQFNRPVQQIAIL